MASFTRSLCLPGLRRVALTPELSSTIRSRLFTTSLRCRAAQPVVKAAARSPIIPRNTPSATPSGTLSKYAFIKSLAAKTTPTVLYEGPSHFWFYFGCWSSGISILAWTVLTAPAAMKQPDDVPQWVGWTFGASYLLLGSMGFFLITKTPNIVGRIRVLSAQAAQTAKAASGPSPLQMEVTVKRMFPMLKPKVITTNIDNVSLKSRFSLPDQYVPELKRLEIERTAEAQQKALRKFDMEHLFTMPFRRMGRAFGNMFYGVKAAWTDMGYAVIEVDGKKYKVDVTQGFAHDGFRTLEKIVEIKP